MVAFTKAAGFIEHLGNGVHNLSADQLKVALTNTAPAAETNNPLVATADCIVASLTEIANYANLLGVNPRNVTTTSWDQTGGTGTLVLADLTLTANGGSVGPFRYYYLFNDDPTSPADPIIAAWDRGAALTLADGESVTLDFANTTFA